jgi:riboflavin synthase
MFTGIIQAVGTMAAMEPRGGDMALHISSGDMDMQTVALGDSIATNGVCLTVIELPGDGYIADVSRETLAHTTLGELKPGSPVNLEKALTLDSHLGGHLVSGHVDGVGRILERRDDGRSVRFRIDAPTELARYIAHKGSICIDGVSLTVNAVHGSEFELNIVPHTIQETTISGYRSGTKVNIEVDQIARYLERLLLGDKANGSAEPSGVTEELLARNGFLR